MIPVVEGLKVGRCEVECDMGVLQNQVRINDEKNGYKIGIKPKHITEIQDKLDITVEKENITIISPTDIEVNIIGQFKEFNLKTLCVDVSVLCDSDRKFHICQKENTILIDYSSAKDSSV